jgi:hypothetical protein
MLARSVAKTLPGLSYPKTRRIFRISRRCGIAVFVTLGTFGPSTALAAHSATRSPAAVVASSQATQPGRQSILSRRIDSPDARPDPFGEDRIVDQLYARLMQESARVLHVND